MTPKERLLNACEEAELAFWAKVAELYPEIKTGDLPPELVFEMEEKNMKWVAYWVGSNGNQYPCFIDQYDEEHFCNECGEIKVPAGVKMCKDCIREELSREMGID
jgi:hypothetical protein